MTRIARWLWAGALACGLLAGPAFAADTTSAQEQAQRQSIQPGNNAPVWRDVRGGDNPYQTSQVRGRESTVLVQPAGETWRQLRNGPITVYGGWLIVLMVIAIGAFYGFKGPIRLKDKPTGRLIKRFNAWERTVHWSLAASFILLGITGLVILFGKHILLPVIGYTLFSYVAILSKNIHNFMGPLFAFCTILMFFTYVRDNLPSGDDLKWIIKGGGLFTGEHVTSGRFNAGEKSWFWIGVTFLGILVSASGFILNFPNFDQTRELMQQANTVHAVVAVAFISMALGHIYIGSLGVEGAYEGMRTGYVDEVWAKEHHERWYHEVAERQPAGGAARAAPASSMKEGWKV